MLRSLVGSEMCIRDRYQRRVRGNHRIPMPGALSGKHVVIEGNIASGKSTLCHDIRDTDVDQVHVCKETSDEMFLKYFYQNPAQYAFSFQAYMLKTRLFQMINAMRIAKDDGKLVLMDRGALGDTCFAKLNWLHGKMDDGQWELYERLCSAESFTQTASESVDCIVYLDVEPVDCRHRVREMRKTESEQEIPLSYFQGIDDMYFDLMIKTLQDSDSPKVLVMRWGEFGCTQEMLQRLGTTLDETERTPRVYKNVELETYPACCYDDCDEIQAMYDALSPESGDASLDIASDADLGPVQIRWDMCFEDKPQLSESCLLYTSPSPRDS
eukprot:TRINITY_DN6047_c0_g2_i1.p1 TRINITY_DN6047_c0_g2~~TRINITY_DN6047_c0_g2_i1.p1  ORF type:complete len:326 (+),score=77.25 TRINITY_DN6047_c0_g2_i1:164-1141(+)